MTGAGRLVVERCEIPSDDATLVGDVYRTDDDRQRPCLLQRVPYGRTLPGIANGALDVRRAVDAGFVVVVQDCRGRGESTGRFVPFQDERSDALSTFDWIVAQPWSDGTIGMFGRSYAGLNQWLAASGGHPALRAIAPTISGGDPREWLWPDGVLEWGFALWWAVRYLAPGAAAGATTLDERSDFDELMSLARDPDTLFSTSPAALRELSRRTVPYLAGWLNGEPGGADAGCTGAIDQPVFLTAGWFDIFARSALSSWTRSVTHPSSRLVIGPWAHGGTFAGVYPDWDAGPRASDAAIDLAGQQLAWFRAVLAGDAPPAGPTVQSFVCGADRWAPLRQWPPSTAGVSTFAAAPEHDGSLRLEPSTSPSAAPDWRRDLRSDPADPFPTRGGPTFLPGMEVAALAGPRSQLGLLERDDVVVASTRRLDDPVTVLGAAEVDVDVDVELHVALPEAAPVAGLVCVRLCDEAPDGTVVNVSEGAVALDAAPGRRTVRVSVGPSGWRFDPGHRALVAITRASWPRFRVEGDAPDLSVCGIAVHLSIAPEGEATGH